MTLVLHHAWRSSASRRVRLCLAEKGLAYSSVPVDMERLDHHAPEYLRINPNGQVPTLVHDNRPLHESGTICEYLDEIEPALPLRPADAYGRALVRNWVRHVDGLIGNLIVFNWRHSLQKVAQAWSDEELARRLAQIPSAERREAWLRVARRPYTEAERGAARDRLVALLDTMEAMLADTGWLVGDAYGLADIAVVPFAKRIEEEIAPEAMQPAAHPAVARWWAAVQARPAYAQANIGPFTPSTETTQR